VVPWFGYLTTFQWCFSYVSVVPIIIGCSVQSIAKISKVASKLRIRPALLSAAYVTGVALSALIVGREVFRSWTVLPDEYAQWNDLTVLPSGLNISNAMRTALYVVGYLHYFAAYSLFCSCVIGVTLLAGASALRRNARAYRSQGLEDLRDLLIGQKQIVLASLVYVVLLRSSKVGMFLAWHGRSPDLNHVYQFLENATPYFEAARGGTLANLLLVGLWCLLCFISHVFAGSMLRASAPAVGEASRGLPGLFGEACDMIGWRYLGLAGVCIVAITLPPPGGQTLVAVSGVAGGLYLVRRGFRERR
jgi:hypothetical protein